MLVHEHETKKKGIKWPESHRSIISFSNGCEIAKSLSIFHLSAAQSSRMHTVLTVLNHIHHSQGTKDITYYTQVM